MAFVSTSITACGYILWFSCTNCIIRQRDCGAVLPYKETFSVSIFLVHLILDYYPLPPHQLWRCFSWPGCLAGTSNFLLFKLVTGSSGVYWNLTTFTFGIYINKFWLSEWVFSTICILLPMPRPFATVFTSCIYSTLMDLFQTVTLIFVDASWSLELKCGWNISHPFGTSGGQVGPKIFSYNNNGANEVG